MKQWSVARTTALVLFVLFSALNSYAWADEMTEWCGTAERIEWKDGTEGTNCHFCYDVEDENGEPTGCDAFFCDEFVMVQCGPT